MQEENRRPKLEREQSQPDLHMTKSDPLASLGDLYDVRHSWELRIQKWLREHFETTLREAEPHIMAECSFLYRVR